VVEGWGGCGLGGVREKNNKGVVFVGVLGSKGAFFVYFFLHSYFQTVKSPGEPLRVRTMPSFGYFV